MLKRRQFLQGAAAATALTAAPYLTAHALGPNRYELIAAPGAQRLGGADQPPTDLLLYNSQSPGPLLTGRISEMLEVAFTNKLDMPTTIHWHGIRNLNEMDGVPDLTQAAVDPGERFIYRFPLKDAGTFWYHAHNMAWQQVTRGLYGGLVVYDDDASADAADDITLIADDWRLDADYAIDEASLGSLHDWSHAGRLGNWLTINGMSQPEINLPAAGQVRLRLVNAANARPLYFELEAEGEGDFTVIAVDAAPCAPFTARTLTLAPAQRIDVLIDAARATGLNEVTGQQPVSAARFTKDAAVTGAPFLPAAEPWYPRPDTAAAKVIDIHMQGGAMGNLDAAEFEGEEKSLRELATDHGKVWAFNGIVGGYDHILADLALGDVAVLRIWNDSRWQHAMHLHGHHFWVQSREFGETPRWLLRDTYLMQPNEKAELIFVADNPGMWLCHCHMLEHHAAGMGGVIAIT